MNFLFFVLSNRRKPISARKRAKFTLNHFQFVFFIQSNRHTQIFGRYLSQSQKLKVKFFPLKSARNCPPYKRPKKSKFAITKLVCLCRKSGQFVKDFSVTESVFFLFLLCRITTEAMGIWRFAGAFAVVKRQSECGSKTRRNARQPPMRIGVCQGLGARSFYFILIRFKIYLSCCTLDLD